MLSSGNSKVGNLLNFSIPAYETCPGHTGWCETHCYARKGRFVFANVKTAHRMNAITSSSDKFVYDMLCELDRHPKAKYVRIHVSGDFYDVDYTERWRRIIAARPDIKFYALTRSWRISELKTKLEELRALPNCVIRASTDEQTGPPPEGWLEGGIEKTYTEGGILCPYFDKGIQCDKCLLCYKGTKAIYFKEH